MPPKQKQKQQDTQKLTQQKLNFVKNNIKSNQQIQEKSSQNKDSINSSQNLETENTKKNTLKKTNSQQEQKQKQNKTINEDKHDLYNRNLKSYMQEIQKLEFESKKEKSEIYSQSQQDKYQNQQYNYNLQGYILTSSDEEDENQSKNFQSQTQSQKQKNLKQEDQTQIVKKFLRRNVLLRKYKDEENLKEKEEEETSIKNENQSLSNKTCEDRPYIRREHMISNYKQFCIYNNKMKNYDVIPLAFSNAIFLKPYERLEFKVKYHASKILEAFKREGIKEKFVFNYILEKSMNTPLLRKWCKKFFQNYLQDPIIQGAFDREFSYRKGSIDYFDPDFQGKINTVVDFYNLKYIMVLEGYKDKLYMRVMMTMLKKLCRFLYQFQMVEETLYKNCGKNISYDITFFFKYRVNMLGGGRKLPKPTKFSLQKDLQITIYYLQEGVNSDINQDDIDFLMKQEVKSEEKLECKAEDQQNCKIEPKIEKKEEKMEEEYQIQPIKKQKKNKIEIKLEEQQQFQQNFQKQQQQNHIDFIENYYDMDTVELTDSDEENHNKQNTKN